MHKKVVSTINMVMGLILLHIIGGCQFVDTQETPTLSTVSPPQGTVSSTTPSSTLIRYLLTGSLIFTDYSNIFRIDTVSGNTQVLARDGVYFSPIWLRNGFVYFREGYESPQIYRMSHDGSQIEQITTGDDFVGNFAVSNDGRHLAYASGEGLTLLEFNNTGETIARVVLERNLPTESLVWTNNGEKLAFLEWPDDEEGNEMAAYGSLYIVDSDGQNLKHIPSAGLRISTNFPAWSPDDSKIAIPIKDQYGTNLYIVDGNSNEFHPLTSVEGVVSSPLWSPDGTMILFILDRQLCVIKPNESTFTVFADKFALVGKGYQAVWSPDGHYIAYVEERNNLPVLNIVPSIGGETMSLEIDVDLYHINYLSWVLSDH